MDSESLRLSNRIRENKKAIQAFTDPETMMPVGSMLIWTCLNIPTGWLLCDGTAVNRDHYKSLFEAIGTTYGNGDGSTTFNLPNLKDRFPLGATGPLGVIGSAETVTLATSQTPSSTSITCNFIIAYRDVKIPFKGDKGDKGSQGVKGVKGDNAPLIQYQFSSDGVSWHTTFDSGDVYIRFSSDDASTWGDSILFKGEQGIQGIQGDKGDKGDKGNTGDIGEKGVSLRGMGSWNAETEYINNSSYIDIVEHNGSSYSCKLTHTNQAPPCAAYWDLVAHKGDTGEQGKKGVSFRHRGGWCSTTEYLSNSEYIDVVLRNGSSYACKTTHTGQEPPNTSYWELVAIKGLDGTGTGDVIGPTSSEIGNVAVFDSTTGKVIKDVGEKLSDYVPISGGTLAGNLSISKVGAGSAATFNLHADTGRYRDIIFRTGAERRWVLRTNADAESGSDEGSNFLLKRYKDDGTTNTIFEVNRATGITDFNYEITKDGNTVWHSGNIDPLPKSGGTMSGKLQVADEDHPYAALMQTSSHTNEYLFGGANQSDYSLDSYVRVGQSRLKYNNGSASYNILHAPILNRGSWTGNSGSSATQLAASFYADGANSKITFYGNSSYKMDIVTDGEYYAHEGNSKVWHEGNLNPGHFCKDNGRYLNSSGGFAGTCVSGSIRCFNNSTGSTGFPTTYGVGWHFDQSSHGRNLTLWTQNGGENLYFQTYNTSGNPQGWNRIYNSGQDSFLRKYPSNRKSYTLAANTNLSLAISEGETVHFEVADRFSGDLCMYINGDTNKGNYKSVYWRSGNSVYTQRNFLTFGSSTSYLSHAQGKIFVLDGDTHISGQGMRGEATARMGTFEMTHGAGSVSSIRFDKQVEITLTKVNYG